MALFGGHHPQIDSGSDISIEVDASLQRLITVEKDSLDMDKNISDRDEKLASEFESMETEIELLQHEIRHVRSMMRVLMKYAQKLIIQLQNKSKKDDLVAITKVADRWAPELYVTKKEFIRIAGDEIKRSLLQQRL